MNSRSPIPSSKPLRIVAASLAMMGFVAAHAADATQPNANQCNCPVADRTAATADTSAKKPEPRARAVSALPPQERPFWGYEAP
ncbi:MAG: hypothetical protein AMXMBFR6_22600 [Betaproteobacteria bacterium]|nr:hypothetical protein [Rhodocyclaceae bacterium]MCG3187816.1 hypothetical protein [Rhodocyclaceae bacterium]